MKIKGENLNDELIMEIGKFTILWNCFERYQCQNLCNPTKIKSISTSLNIKNEEMLELANVLNKRRSWFGQIIPDYVETGLHPGNARMSRAEERHLMEEFMGQKSEDMRCGCLLVIHRIRNNLMHGLKRIEQLNDQLELFRAVNGVLESVAFAD